MQQVPTCVTSLWPINIQNSNAGLSSLQNLFDLLLPQRCQELDKI